jgi:DNA gyrase subunit A
MRLKQLTGLEREKLEKEYKELVSKIAYLRSILESEKKVLDIIKKELLVIKKKFADPRRSFISDEEVAWGTEDLIPEEDVVITITNQGYIKRILLDTYRNQRRGGRGVMAMGTKTEDFVRHLFVTTTHHFFLFFTNQGKVFRLKVHEIPEAGRRPRHRYRQPALYRRRRKITAVIPVKEFDSTVPVHASRHGWLKTSLDSTTHRAVTAL